jgi:hypothetical protein
MYIETQGQILVKLLKKLTMLQLNHHLHHQQTKNSLESHQLQQACKQSKQPSSSTNPAKCIAGHQLSNFELHENQQQTEKESWRKLESSQQQRDRVTARTLIELLLISFSLLRLGPCFQYSNLQSSLIQNTHTHNHKGHHLNE